MMKTQWVVKMSIHGVNVWSGSIETNDKSEAEAMFADFVAKFMHPDAKIVSISKGCVMMALHGPEQALESIK